jgi:hypothetical protein
MANFDDPKHQHNHKLTRYDHITTFQLVNPTISCLAMDILVVGEEAKSELSCCGMKTQSNMLKLIKYRA